MTRWAILAALVFAASCSPAKSEPNRCNSYSFTTQGGDHPGLTQYDLSIVRALNAVMAFNIEPRSGLPCLVKISSSLDQSARGRTIITVSTFDEKQRFISKDSVQSNVVGQPSAIAAEVSSRLNAHVGGSASLVLQTSKSTDELKQLACRFASPLDETENFRRQLAEAVRSSRAVVYEYLDDGLSGKAACDAKCGTLQSKFGIDIVRHTSPDSAELYRLWNWYRGVNVETEIADRLNREWVKPARAPNAREEVLSPSAATGLPKLVVWESVLNSGQFNQTGHYFKFWTADLQFADPKLKPISIRGIAISKKRNRLVERWYTPPTTCEGLPVDPGDVFN